MVRGIRAARVLQGMRGALPADEGALVEAICRLGQLASDFPDIAELDVNPLLALPDGGLGRAPYLLPYVDPSARCCVA